MGMMSGSGQGFDTDSDGGMNPYKKFAKGMLRGAGQGMMAQSEQDPNEDFLGNMQGMGSLGGGIVKRFRKPKTLGTPSAPTAWDDGMS
jgi:hypothetical protein